MKRLALIVNRAKYRAVELVPTIQKLATYHHITVVDTPEEAEAIAVLGGDGTLLSAVHRYGAERPIIGLNAGSLGYLTCVEEGQFEAMFKALAEDRYTVSHRQTLTGRVVQADGTVRCHLPIALNDITIARGLSARALKLTLGFDAQPVADYLCDGIIFATPTGSTAYALSAGGPVVMPDIAATVMAAISPHSLTARPLVYPNTLTARIERADNQVPWLVSADGQEDIELLDGDAVEITTGKLRVSLIVPTDYDPLKVLRHKLGWSLRHSL